jgi:hypothetical protein
MRSATPRRDAIRAWLDAGDWSAPLVIPEPDYDPTAGLDDEQRAELVIAMCASGAPAELPRRTVLINGRRIPEPPPRQYKHGKRNHAPRPRKTRREVPS